MSNSLRHSRAKTGDVSLRLLKRNVRLEVTDDGAGFDMHKKGKHGEGLRNMMARAKEIGARFEVVSQRGQGTRVILDIPLARENA
jgi:NarL family two-component system sensor histidine kinase LiaS